MSIKKKKKKESNGVQAVLFKKLYCKIFILKYKAILAVSGVPLLALNVFCNRKRKKRRMMKRG